MRVAFILPSLANKGPILVVKDLCDYLVEKKNYCKVFYFDDVVEVSMKCEVQRICFWQKINFDDFDIVHSHLFRPDAYVYFHKLFVRSKIKFVTTVHQHIGELMPYSYNFWKAFLLIKFWLIFLRTFDVIVVLSEYHKLYYQQFSKLKDIKIIYNGRNVENTDNIIDSDLSKIEEFRLLYKTIGSVAGIVKCKGFEQLIKSLPFLPEYGLIFVGDGEEVFPLRQLARNLDVADRCLWLGACLDGYRYMKYFDIFAMCSRTEGFPLTLIEAAAYGKPTLCSNIPILHSIIDNQKVCFFDLDNIDSLVRAIRNLELNSEQYSLNISRYYESSLTVKVMAENYCALYRQL